MVSRGLKKFLNGLKRISEKFEGTLDILSLKTADFFYHKIVNSTENVISENYRPTSVY